MAYFSTSTKSKKIANVQKCFTFDPSRESPSGARGKVKFLQLSPPIKDFPQVQFVVPTSGVSQVDVYAHNRGQMFAPTSSQPFGGAKRNFFNFNYGLSKHRQHMVTLDISKVEEKRIDKPRYT